MGIREPHALEAMGVVWSTFGKVPGQAIAGASRDLRYCHPEDMGFMEGQGLPGL